jgi:carbon-monoxide dehydrogenase medium subunit/6-hydroxypseudooxynicotine dehydrogenase subunit alpha
MKPPPFAYARAESVEHALDLLAEGGDEAKPIAGGQSLMPALAYRIVRPTHLVDIGRLPELEDAHDEGDALRLGALVRHSTLAASAWGERWRGLRAAAAHIGHDAIRVRGTIGGSLVHADPAAELPVVLAGLGGEVTARSRAGARTIDGGELFLAPFTTSLSPGELLVDVRLVAPPDDARTAFTEFAPRAGDFALACVFVGLGAGWARIAVGGVSGTPVRAVEAEELARAGDLDGAADAAARGLEVYGDRFADETYRRELVRTLTRRALAEAAA